MKNCTEIIAQRQTIENALKTYIDIQNSCIDSYSADVTKMLRCIHEHLFKTTLSVEGVKKVCRLTNNNVTTKFLYEVGLRPSEYIRYQRLKAAAAILNKHEVNIYLLAISIGYTEEAFSKIFKKVYGEPPSQYRQKAGEIRAVVLRDMDKKFKQEKILRETVKSL